MFHENFELTFKCIYIFKESKSKVCANQSTKLEVEGEGKSFFKLNNYALQNFAQMPDIGRLENKRTWKSWKVKQYRFKKPRLIISLSFEKEHSKKASPKYKEDAATKRIIMYQQILSVWRDITKTASQPWNRYLIPQSVFKSIQRKVSRCHFLCLTHKNRHLL